MREPIVSGKFYPNDKTQLEKKISENFTKVLDKFDSKGIMVPHAGYIYSGNVAAAVFSCIKPADIYVIMGPNHTGYGENVSISNEKSWATPLGEIAIDDEFRTVLLESSDIFIGNDDAHRFEHSIEVQLPFLQFINSNFSFVPIVFGRVDFETCKEIAKIILDAINKLNKKVVIVASSDMTHYEPHDKAKRKDYQVIEKILDLDSEKVWDTVKSERISMCGLIPVVIMIDICKSLGAENAELIKYETSGDVTGDKSSVVGYGGVVIY